MVGKKIIISDSTLRDGNHAIGHQLTTEQISAYATAAELAGIPMIEVGHGNGIGASSLQVGESKLSDEQMLTAARKILVSTKLAIHCMPGIATINKDLSKALEIGVDVVRVGSHCTEADITQRHIGFVRDMGKEVYGCLMMTHMATKETLIKECLKLESYGSKGVILMDSAGSYVPWEVSERIKAIVAELKIPIGFHAHNNLGLGIGNSIAAVEAGATMLDGSARGFGAGAGNAQLEVLIAVLHKLGYETGISLFGVMDAAEIAEQLIIKEMPQIKSISLVSGLSGVFSGFAKHVERIAVQYGVDAREIFFELGKRKVVGGQEDLIIEVAASLLDNKINLQKQTRT